MSCILYKYLDIKGGKMMIGNKTLQFTNASQLNDPFDFHPNLVDYSDIPESIRHGVPLDWYIEKEKNDALNLRNDTWLSSFSKVNNSLLMWSHYCWNHSGVCVGMDLDRIMANVSGMGVGMIYINPLVLEVRYQDIVERPKAYHTPEDIFHYQLQTKAKDWAYEQEVRLAIEASPKEGVLINSIYEEGAAKMHQLSENANLSDKEKVKLIYQEYEQTYMKLVKHIK